MTAIGRVDAPPRIEVGERPPPVPLATGTASFAGRAQATPVYRRADVGRGATVAGPCVLLEDACTTLVPPGWLAACTGNGHLLLERSR
jgi:N-methylhydantoinase A/oxoprolinase/acetone carboxylase beta subunit